MRFLSAILFSAFLFSPAQAQVVVMMAGECRGYANTVKSVLDSIKVLPQFEVVITCDDAIWRYWQMRYGAEETNGAFVNGKYSRVVLRGKAIDNPVALRTILLHEIEHLRCRCTLGEK